MIRIKNESHEAVVVRDEMRYDQADTVLPGHEMRFIGQHFSVKFAPIRRIDSRFDARGGDPYNRVGRKAFA